MKYVVSEEFLSFQGEGCFAGQKAYFIRLFGCPVKCAWCDTKYAWGDSLNTYCATAEELAKRAKDSLANFAVITGGEPCAQNLLELANALKNANVKTHLETSGFCENSAEFDWITLSPKLGKPVKQRFLDSANEAKFIVSQTAELPEYENLAKLIPNGQAYWLHCEASKSADKALLNAISNFVVQKGGKFRVGWQLHKLFNAK